MIRRNVTRLNHVRDHILGLGLGALPAEFGLVVLQVGGSRATLAIVLGGLVGTLVVPAISQVRSRLTDPTDSA
jgi:hypothetical protein